MRIWELREHLLLPTAKLRICVCHLARNEFRMNEFMVYVTDIRIPLNFNFKSFTRASVICFAFQPIQIF